MGSGARCTGGTRGWSVKTAGPNLRVITSTKRCGWIPQIPCFIIFFSNICGIFPFLRLPPYAGSWRWVCSILVFFTPLRDPWCITCADDKIGHHKTNQSGQAPLPWRQWNCAAVLSARLQKWGLANSSTSKKNTTFRKPSLNGTYCVYSALGGRVIMKL